MRSFGWSLTSFNVNRFRLAFALKEQNKTLLWFHFWGNIFQIGDLKCIVLEIVTECENRARCHPSGALSLCCPPGCFCSGTLTPPLAVCGSGVTNTLDIGESFQLEPPERLLLPSTPEGLLSWEGRWGLKLFVWRIFPPKKIVPVTVTLLIRFLGGFRALYSFWREDMNSSAKVTWR